MKQNEVIYNFAIYNNRSHHNFLFLKVYLNKKLDLKLNKLELHVVMFLCFSCTAEMLISLWFTFCVVC